MKRWYCPECKQVHTVRPNGYQSRILQVFERQSGCARTQDIKSEGIHHKYLQELVYDGTILKIKHGLYSLSELDSATNLHEVLLTVPDGIICMGTALAYYELTTWIHITLLRGRKITLPDYPPIQLYHVSEDIFTIGQTEIETDSGHTIQIYNRERAVCDAIRFRNKIGIDIMKEVLRGYIQSAHRDLNTLNHYVSKLRIESILNQYLDVLQ